jgi:hypothetical protein
MEQSHIILMIIIAITFILLYMVLGEKDKKESKYYCDGKVCKPLTKDDYDGKTYNNDTCNGDCNEEPEPEEVEVYVVTASNSQVLDGPNSDTVKLESTMQRVIVMKGKQDEEPEIDRMITLEQFINDDLWNEDVIGGVIVGDDTDDEINYGITVKSKPMVSGSTFAFNCDPMDPTSKEIMDTIKGMMKGKTSIGFLKRPKNV